MHDCPSLSMHTYGWVLHTIVKKGWHYNVHRQPRQQYVHTLNIFPCWMQDENIAQELSLHNEIINAASNIK